jgi:integrase
MGVKVRKRKGAWWVFIDHRGRRKAKRVGESQEAAEAVAARIQLRLLDEGSAGLERPVAPAPAITFETYARSWLKDYAAATLKANTERFYRLNLEQHVFPVIGNRPIALITRADCKAVIAEARECEKGRRHRGQPKAARRLAAPGELPSTPLTGNTIVGIQRTLSSVLSHAVDDGHLLANPAFRLGRLIRGAHRNPDVERVRALTPQETSILLVTAQQHFPREYPLVLTALLTGMRLGELLGLKWEDIYFAGHAIRVRRNRTAGDVTTPKNGKARHVDMSAGLEKALRALLVIRKEEKLAKGWADVPEWLFCTPEGTPLDGDNFRQRVFAKLVKKAGIRHTRVHDLRHTFASLLIQNGESLAYVRDQLGHSSIQLTVNVYGHLVPGANRDAVDRLDATVTGESATSAQPAEAAEESA